MKRICYICKREAVVFKEHKTRTWLFKCEFCNRTYIVTRSKVRLGGLKSGKARAIKLSSERRSEIAKKATLARWSKSIV